MRRRMGLSVLKPFDESRPGAWLLAGAASLIAAVWAFHGSTKHSVFLVGFALLAVGISIGIATYNSTTPRTTNGHKDFARIYRLPVGTLSVWLGAVVLLSLNPNLNSNPEERRLFIALGVLAFSLVYQGRLAFFAPLPIAGLFVGLREIDLSIGLVLSSPSVLCFVFSFPFAAAVMMIRSSRADSHGVVARLKTMVVVSQDLHARVQIEAEALVNLRESLLGTVDSMPSKEPINELKTLGSQLAALNPSISIVKEQPSLSFEILIAEVRQIFSEFQTQGRALGKISGPIRFVFFPPIAGFDERSEIAVDIGQLRSGLWNCLQLAYESLPETGALRREGVIRLSMRHGFRVIEIAVEDNGRGIQTRSLDAQHGLQQLKGEVESRGGRFERVARLGVGSRTSMELRILSEKPANSRYRATIRHPFTVAESTKESSPSGGAQLV